jgi:hypothetical protein
MDTELSFNEKKMLLALIRGINYNLIKSSEGYITNPNFNIELSFSQKSMLNNIIMKLSHI